MTDKISAEKLVQDVNNANAGTERGAGMLEESFRQLGAGRSVLLDKNNSLVAGNKSADMAAQLDMPVRVIETDGTELIAVKRTDLDLSEKDGKARRLAYMDNRVGEVNLDWAPDTIMNDLDDEFSFEGIFTPAEIIKLLGHDKPENPGALSERFIIPPFSILDTKQGTWQARKKRWLALGLESEKGREGNLMGWGQALADLKGDSVKLSSIFDPVLCELMYRWFSPVGGSVLDPFAGGSVRGVVAGALGRYYTGIELRQEQVSANVQQWDEIKPKVQADIGTAAPTLSDPAMQTPIEQHGLMYIKRDDLFEVAGVRGGKVRTCLALCKDAKGLVTAGSRSSPQVNIVAHIAQQMGIPCRVHTPEGEASPEVLDAEACGAERVVHKAGYNSVIIARAREDAEARGWTNIPFGMECSEAVTQTRAQVPPVMPEGVRRIVMPVGSGMSLAGVLHGLLDNGHDIPVLGVCVGADPESRLDEYAPANWRDMVTLVESQLDYHEESDDEHVVLSDCDVVLDSIYERKCLVHFDEPGDMLWVVGVRATAVPEVIPTGEAIWVQGDSMNIKELLPDTGHRYDMILTCPPYGDLEVYSDDPADISAMEPAEFTKAYAEIIRLAVERLADNRFAVAVVGEYRDKAGNYANFIPATIKAFEDAGAKHYNEIVLANAIGTMPLRATRWFNASRKIGKVHQNVIVFVKGDGKKATEALGTVEAGGFGGGDEE